MEHQQVVFDNNGTGHEGDTVAPSKVSRSTKRKRSCKSCPVQVTQSLLSFYNPKNNMTRCVSDDYLSRQNTKKQQNTRKRSNTICSQRSLYIESPNQSIHARRRQRRSRSIGQYNENETFPLYNFTESLVRNAHYHHAFFKPQSFPQDQLAAIVEITKTKAVPLNSTSERSLSTCHQDDKFLARKSSQSCFSGSTRSNQAKNKKRLYIIDSVRDQFQPMLKDTRLSPKVDGIRALCSRDILPAEPSILGIGTFSRVTRVILRKSNNTDKNHSYQSYACKQIKPELLPNVSEFIKAAAELAYEAFILSCLDHPNIIKLRGFAGDGITSFGDAANEMQETNTSPAKSFFLIMDVLQETLDQRIERWKTISRPQNLVDVRQRSLEKISLCDQLASVLEYIHSKGVVYRDLKPQNIGFCEQQGGLLKLFDFGLCRELPKSIEGAASSHGNPSNHNEHLRFELSGMVGTIRYMAPEVCLSQPYNRDCDIYSWSIVTWEIWSQKKPFETFTPDLYTNLVCKQGYRPTDDRNASFIPTELQSLLKEAWKTEPHQRMRWPEIRRSLDTFQKSEELRLRKLIIGDGTSLRSKVSATIYNPMPTSEPQIHNPSMNRNCSGNIAVSAYVRKSSLGSNQNHNGPSAQMFVPPMAYPTSMSPPTVSMNALNHRIYLSGLNEMTAFR